MDRTAVAQFATQGQTFMLLGTAGPLPSAPKTTITFIEDLDDSELAKAVRTGIEPICYRTCHFVELNVLFSKTGMPADTAQGRSHQSRQYLLSQFDSASSQSRARIAVGLEQVGGKTPW